MAAPFSISEVLYMQSLQNYIMRKMDTQNKKKPGYLLLQAILAMTAFTMMSYGLVLAFSSSFNMYGASKVALEAQQYAEIEANTLKMIGYDKLDTAGHNRAALSYANGWEGQVTIGDEQVIDADNDNKMRIASVDIFKKGDTTSRYTLNVPLTSQGSNLFPIGTILPYAGDLNKIPNGWALCDGQNGTPDLRNRFLTGAGSSYAIGATGGENFHTLTIPEMPSHSHPFSTNNMYVLGDEWINTSAGGILQIYFPQSVHRLINLKSTYSGYSGGSQAHENRPPFYAVYYIMKMA